MNENNGDHSVVACISVCETEGTGSIPVDRSFINIVLKIKFWTTKMKKIKYHYIYKITNKKNNKFYFGMHSTYNLNDGYFGSGTLLWKSIKKYGKENHEIEILEFHHSRKDLAKREKELVNESVVKDPQCLNLKEGGEGGWDHQNLNSEIQRLKGNKGNEAISILRKTNEEWALYVNNKISEANREQWQNGLRVHASKEHMYRMAILSQSNEAALKRKETFKTKKHMQGENNSMFGKRWVLNKELKENKLISKDELDYYLNNGWERGKVTSSWDCWEIKISKLNKEKITAKQLLIDRILKSEIDITKKGWPIKMAIELGVSRNYIKIVIKKYLPELWSKCFIETNKIRKSN